MDLTWEPLSGFQIETPHDDACRHGQTPANGPDTDDVLQQQAARDAVIDLVNEEPGAPTKQEPSHRWESAGATESPRLENSINCFQSSGAKLEQTVLIDLTSMSCDSEEDDLLDQAAGPLGDSAERGDRAGEPKEDEDMHPSKEAKADQEDMRNEDSRHRDVTVQQCSLGESAAAGATDGIEQAPPSSSQVPPATNPAGNEPMRGNNKPLSHAKKVLEAVMTAMKACDNTWPTATLIRTKMEQQGFKFSHPDMRVRNQYVHNILNGAGDKIVQKKTEKTRLSDSSVQSTRYALRENIASLNRPSFHWVRDHQGVGVPGAPRASPASSPPRGEATREARKQQPQANVGGVSLHGRAPQQNEAPAGCLGGTQSSEAGNGTSRSKEVIAAIKRALTPPTKQWLSIREIRMRMEKDTSFRFMTHTSYNQRMDTIQCYMIRSPETKKMFVRKTAASGPDKEDTFALKESLSCSFCLGPFAFNAAAPEICQSCCSVWHPDCLPLMAAGTSAARHQCSDCVKTGGRPHHLELKAGPSGQATSAAAGGNELRSKKTSMQNNINSSSSSKSWKRNAEGSVATKDPSKKRRLSELVNPRPLAAPLPGSQQQQLQPSSDGSSRGDGKRSNKAQVLASIVKAMRGAPGGPWLKCATIMEQMKEDGYEFHTDDEKAQRRSLLNTMKGTGTRLFVMSGNRSTAKYALVELVGMQEEERRATHKVKKKRGMDQFPPLVAAIRRALSDCSNSSPWLSATEIKERLEDYGETLSASSNNSATQRVRNTLNCRVGPRSMFISKKHYESERCPGRVYYALRKNIPGKGHATGSRCAVAIDGRQMAASAEPHQGTPPGAQNTVLLSGIKTAMADCPTGPWLSVNDITDQMERNGFIFSSGTRKARHQDVRFYLDRAGIRQGLFAKKTIDSRGVQLRHALFALRDLLPRGRGAAGPRGGKRNRKTYSTSSDEQSEEDETSESESESEDDADGGDDEEEEEEEAMALPPQLDQQKGKESIICIDISEDDDSSKSSSDSDDEDTPKEGLYPNHKVLKAVETCMEQNPGGPWMRTREVADYLLTQGFALPSRHAAVSVRDFFKRAANKGKFRPRDVPGSRRAVQWTLCSLVKDTTVSDAPNNSGLLSGHCQGGTSGKTEDNGSGSSGSERHDGDAIDMELEDDDMVLKAFENAMVNNPGGPWMTVKQIRESLERDGFMLKRQHFVRHFLNKTSNRGKFTRELRQCQGPGSQNVRQHFALCRLLNRSRRGKKDSTKAHGPRAACEAKGKATGRGRVRHCHDDAEIFAAIEKAMANNPGGPWMTSSAIVASLKKQGVKTNIRIADFVRRAAYKSKFDKRRIRNPHLEVQHVVVGLLSNIQGSTAASDPTAEAPGPAAAHANPSPQQQQRQGGSREAFSRYGPCGSSPDESRSQERPRVWGRAEEVCSAIVSAMMACPGGPWLQLDSIRDKMEEQLIIALPSSSHDVQLRFITHHLDRPGAGNTGRFLKRVSFADPDDGVEFALRCQGCLTKPAQHAPGAALSNSYQEKKLLCLKCSTPSPVKADPEEETREHCPERTEEALPLSGHVGGGSESAQTHPGQGQALLQDARRAAERPQPPSEGSSNQLNVARILRAPDPQYPHWVRVKWAGYLQTSSECLELLKDERILPKGVYCLVEEQMERLHNDKETTADQRRLMAVDVLMAEGLRLETYERWSRKLTTMEDCMDLLKMHHSLAEEVVALVDKQMDIIYKGGNPSSPANVLELE